MLSVYEDRGGGQRSDAAALPARLCRRALHLWLADDGGLWRRERLEAELSEDSLVALDVFKPLDLVGGEGHGRIWRESPPLKAKNRLFNKKKCSLDVRSNRKLAKMKKRNPSLPELLAFRGQWHKPQSFGFANFKDR